MNVAIVGSRKFNDYRLFKYYVNSQLFGYKVDSIISGGAIGTDRMAERYAKEIGKPIIIFKPDYLLHSDNPRYALLARNELIALQCDIMIAFICGKSNGTKHAIEYARKLNKPVYVIEI